MRIAFATPEYTTEHTYDGGLANYVHRTALALRDMRHEPVIFVPYHADESFTDEGIQVHRVETWNPTRMWLKLYTYVRIIDRLSGQRFHMALNLWWRSFVINRRILGEHRKCPFDVIHYAHLGGLGLLCPKKLPSVARLSSSTRLCQEFGGYGGSNVQIRQQEWIERIALRKADTVFGPSERIARLTKEETGVEVRVIESPFLNDCDALDQSLYVDHLHNKTYLLFFGSIGLIKGVGTIAAVIHSLLSMHPDLYFVFVGKRVPGQDGGDLMEHVWREAKDHRDRVLWFPAQPHSKLYPVIQHARGVVLPSRIDNFPNACIEAMAYGRMVIGTIGNGFEQLIAHGKSGFLCAVDDPKGLLRAIEDLLALPLADQRRMAELATQRIEKLRPEETVGQVIDCYLVAIERHGKKRDGQHDEGYHAFA